ncbi:MAG TPA: CAP domain-containing protein [Sphingomicrobium sp.]|nr:CAP domain-containing protein [Sphingomicrobium sp.]
MNKKIVIGGLLFALCSPPAQAQSFAAAFPARVLAAHNAFRAQVGAPPMVWDSALGTSAAAYAQQMAVTSRFEHSDRRARRGVGENLWMGTRGAFSIETMVGDWASERRYFVPGIFPNVSRTGNWIDVGHYTQMIWPTTQRLGCALATTARTDYLVCHYAPAGNIDGRYVGPPLPQRGS